MMQRIPEPDLMNDPAQAAAYAAADFAEPHDTFVQLFHDHWPDWSGDGLVLDLGCGPADVTIRFARAYPNSSLLGIDGAEAMLACGRQRIADEGLSARIELHACYLPAQSAELQSWLTRSTQSLQAIISNSLLHHLQAPQVLWQTIRHCAVAGTRVAVMDLLRPTTTAQTRALVDEYAADEPEILRHDFYHSLLAAYTVDEVAAQLQQAGLEEFNVAAVSDRHLLVSGQWQGR